MRIIKKFIKFGTGADEVNSQALPANYTPTNYTPVQVASEGTDKVSAHLKGINNALAAGSGPTIFGSRGTPRDIVAGTGITSGASHMSTTALTQVIFIQGSGGAVDLTANPQIEAHTVVGARLTLIGRSDTNTVKLDTGTGLELNGSVILGASDIIELMWDGTAYIEIGRNN